MCVFLNVITSVIIAFLPSHSLTFSAQQFTVIQLGKFGAIISSNIFSDLPSPRGSSCPYDRAL